MDQPDSMLIPPQYLLLQALRRDASWYTHGYCAFIRASRFSGSQWEIQAPFYDCEWVRSTKVKCDT